MHNSTRESYPVQVVPVCSLIAVVMQFIVSCVACYAASSSRTAGVAVGAVVTALFVSSIVIGAVVYYRRRKLRATDTVPVFKVHVRATIA